MASAIRTLAKLLRYFFGRVAGLVRAVDSVLLRRAGQENTIHRTLLRVLMVSALIISAVALWAMIGKTLILHNPQTMTNSIGMQLTLIPAGEFMMGSPESEKNHTDAETQHRVRITRAFYMGVYEVTQVEYERVMGTNPSHFSSTDKNRNRFPVESVSWDDAQEFCRRLSQKEGKIYRLPTEAEWEYACRAGSTTAYYFGNDPSELDQYGWYKTSNESRRVGEKRPNAWGLYDMHGNVQEWCQDFYSANYYYANPPVDENTPVIDPKGPSAGTSRVFRGGDSREYGDSAVNCRSAYRNSTEPTDGYSNVGFRVLRER